MILDHRRSLRRFRPILAIALVACGESSPAADSSTTRTGPLPDVPEPSARSNDAASASSERATAGAPTSAPVPSSQPAWIAGASRIIQSIEGFGELGTAHFTANGVQLAEIVVRVHPGVNGSARFRSNGPEALFTITWPDTTARPTVVALKK